MLYEMEKLIANHTLFGVPVRLEWDPKIKDKELNLRRRLVREETEETLDALVLHDLLKTGDGLADTMYVTAGSAVQLGVTPGIEALIGGYRALMEGSRQVFETGCMTRNVVDLAGGMAMLEIVHRGLAACLNIPYREFFDVVHAANMRKVGPDGKPIFDKGGKYLKPEGWEGPDAEQRALLELLGFPQQGAGDAVANGVLRHADGREENGGDAGHNQAVPDAQGSLPSEPAGGEIPAAGVATGGSIGSDAEDQRHGADGVSTARADMAAGDARRAARA